METEYDSPVLVVEWCCVEHICILLGYMSTMLENRGNCVTDLASGRWEGGCDRWISKSVSIAFINL